ncbi:MAG: cellulose synthase subunit BcsC [Acidobacteria bacterium]|nr:cellulose synthase subunit BcsC [Acidobacteriota bacterium]
MRRRRHVPSPATPVHLTSETPWSVSEWGIVAALVALTAIVFGQLVTHQLLFGDDVLLRTTSWWQPLTTLFRKLGGGHFAVNLALHAASSVVLFIALRKLTGATGRSAFVAAIFAVHPMHVETVARLAEQQQLLATLFALLAILAYAQRRMLFVATAFAASLLCDQTYVALPLLLLLLDWWPLDRLREERDLKPRLFEKLPLLALSIAGAVVAVMNGWSAPPLANALASYTRFLGRFIAPTDLAMPYPPQTIASSSVFGAAILLLLISFAVISVRRSLPWLATGWFWFVIALTGAQTFADRYSYFSYIGLAIIVAWAGAMLPRTIAAIAGAIVIIACAATAFQQTTYWQNNDTLYSHTIAVTPPNADAEYALGASLRASDPERAVEHLQRAFEIAAVAMRGDRNAQPAWLAQAYADIATAFFSQGEKAPSGAERTNLLQGAIGASRRALAVDANIAEAKTLIPRAEKLLAADPHSARDSHINAGRLLTRQGRFADAIAEFRKAVAADPHSVDSHICLALGLLQANQKEEARTELAAAKTIDGAAANDVLTKLLQLPPGPANFDTFTAEIR